MFESLKNYFLFIQTFFSFPSFFLQNNEIVQNGRCMTLSADKKSITMESCTGGENQKWVMSRKPFQPGARNQAR